MTAQESEKLFDLVCEYIFSDERPLGCGMTGYEYARDKMRNHGYHKIADALDVIVLASHQTTTDEAREQRIRETEQQAEQQKQLNLF